MNAPFIPAPGATGIAPCTACLPHELPGVLDWFPGLGVLSLDCFDTLLWRDCHAPADLFAALPDVNPFQRIHGEARARQIARAARGVHDIALDEIYRTVMPGAKTPSRDRARKSAIAAEIAAEARHCFGFAPTITLMQEAKRRGMQVILVSDTYLGPNQLRDLVALATGADTAALIDQVFASSTYGLPKSAGLFREVLARIKARPDQILHIGDNARADVDGVAPFGVHTLHLQQFTDRTAQQLRQESAVAALLERRDCRAITAPQPHRAALAVGMPQQIEPAQQLGFASLGPVLFGYDQWLRDEARALQAAGDCPARAAPRTVHWLFLMRDGHLPMRMHQAINDLRGATAGPVHAVEISRLTATFASFAHGDAILRHLEENRGVDPEILARQLRLPDATVARLCTGRSHQDGWSRLYDWCRVPANRRAIVVAAQAMADRLVTHVRNTVSPAPGDTLMLVDLGYNGSVQSLIDPLLTRALGVHIAGRYLILRESLASGLDKRGYLGADHYDYAQLNAFTANVAVIEQLATTALGSVVDYTDDGQPVRGSNAISPRQNAVREHVQQGCLAFASHATAHGTRVNGTRVNASGMAELWRPANAATLMRLMYLPLRQELDVIRAFEHDVNLGTGELLALFDPATAHEGLVRQGLFYQKGVRRMFLPAELAHQGLAIRLTHLATACFPMPLTSGDFADDAGYLPVFLNDAREATRIELPYRATHDGFFAVCIPVGPGRYMAAVPFGVIAPYVEIHSIVAMPAREYLNNRHDSILRENRIMPQFDGITPLTNRLWHCPDRSGLALFQTSPIDAATNLVIVVVFRAVGT